MTTPAPRLSQTIILVPEGRYDELRALAARWVDAYLIEPVLMIRTGVTARTMPPGDSVPVVAADHLVRGRVDPVADLAKWLEDPRRPTPELLRVIDVVMPREHAVTWLIDPREDARAIAEVLMDSANRLPVHRVAVLVKPSAHRAARGALLREDGDVPQPRWEVNVLASPENRGRPGGFDAFVRASDSDELNGFALAHVATAGGLWSGVRNGPFDHVQKGTRGHLEVQRVLVRGVLLGTRRLMAATIGAALVVSDPGPLSNESGHRQRGAGSPQPAPTVSGPDGKSLGALTKLETDRALEELVRRLLDEVPLKPLRARTADIEIVDVSDRIALRDLVVGLWADLVAALRSIPRLPGRAVSAVRATVSRRREELGIDPVLADIPRLIPILERQLERVENEIGRCRVLRNGRLIVPSRRSPSGTAHRVRTAGVWRVLHGGSMFLMDGDAQGDARDLRRWMDGLNIEGVLTGPGPITPDPQERWSASDELLRIIGSDGEGWSTSISITDLYGLWLWTDILAPWVRIAKSVLAGGPGDMTESDAQLVLAADEELRTLTEQLEPTLVGRIQIEGHNELQPVWGLLLAVQKGLRKCIASATTLRPSRMAAAVAPALLLAGASAPLVLTSSRAVALTVGFFGLGVALLLASHRIASARRAALRRFSEHAVALDGAADLAIAEWYRNEHCRNDAGAMMLLLGYLLHHGVDVPRPRVDPPVLPSAEELPMLVRVAEPDDRDDDVLAEPGRPAERIDLVDHPKVRRVMRHLLTAGWRSRLHDRFLELLAAEQPELFGGDEPHAAIDADPQLAAEAYRLALALRPSPAATVGRELVRKGVRILEGARNDERGAPSRTTMRGTPSRPSARVRVVANRTPSADARRDALSDPIAPNPGWDEFLRGAIERDTDWGAHVFDTQGAGRDAIDRRRTIIHAPARLLDGMEVDMGAERRVEPVPLRDDDVFLTELVVRVDVQPEAVSTEAIRGLKQATGPAAEE